MCTGAGVPPLASPLVRGVGNLGTDSPEEGGDHRPSLLYHRVPENLSEGESKVRGGAPTHGSSNHTLDRMHGRTVNTEVPLCSVGDVWDSGVAQIFQNLGLTTEIVHSPMDRQGGDDIHKVEGLNNQELQPRNWTFSGPQNYDKSLRTNNKSHP